MSQREVSRQVPTTRCLKCGADFAAACPACPYCAWVPLQPGRSAWQRAPVIAVGVLGSAALAVLAFVVEDAIHSDAGLSGYVFAGGVLLTILFANRYVGGGKDIF